MTVKFILLMFLKNGLLQSFLILYNKEKEKQYLTAHRIFFYF